MNVVSAVKLRNVSVTFWNTQCNTLENNFEYDCMSCPVMCKLCLLSTAIGR